MTKQVTFQASEDFSQALPKAQVNEVAAWVAANPKATIVATGIAEGGLPPYLRRDTGKRANINRTLSQGLTVAEFLTAARPLGGGSTALVAALAGGYSRSAVGYGSPCVKLVA